MQDNNNIKSIIQQAVRAAVSEAVPIAVQEVLRELRQRSASDIPAQSGVLKRAEAARYVGVVPTSLDRLVRRGLVGSFGEGHQRRFSISEHLDPFLRGEGGGQNAR